MDAKLPEKAKEVFDSLYAKAVEKGMNDIDAQKSALLGLKKIYTQVKQWQSNDLHIKKTITKSSSGTHVHMYMDGILSLPGSDNSSMFNTVSENLLTKFTNKDFIESYGTIDHSEYEKDLKTPLSTKLVKGKEPALLDDIKLVDNKLHIRFKLNPEYEDYEKLIELQKQGHYLKLSAEFKDALTYNNVIVDANRLGWTLTSTPANDGAVIYNIDRVIE